MWPNDLLDLDHVLPRALGGAKGPVRWAHRSCNRRDGRKLQAEMDRRRPVRSKEW